MLVGSDTKGPCPAVFHGLTLRKACCVTGHHREVSFLFGFDSLFLRWL
jgi:hypothetical protein